METSFFLTARGLIKSLFKESARRNPPIPVLGERRVIPRIRVQIQLHKPVEGQTPSQHAHQGSLGGHASRYLPRSARKSCLGGVDWWPTLE